MFSPMLSSDINCFNGDFSSSNNSLGLGMLNSLGGLGSSGSGSNFGGHGSNMGSGAGGPVGRMGGSGLLGSNGSSMSTGGDSLFNSLGLSDELVLGSKDRSAVVSSSTGSSSAGSGNNVEKYQQRVLVAN